MKMNSHVSEELGSEIPGRKKARKKIFWEELAYNIYGKTYWCSR